LGVVAQIDDYAYGATTGPNWPAAGSAGLVPPVPFLYAKSDEDSGARLVDLNRDGLPDVELLEGRISAFSAAAATTAAWLNTGQAFQYSAAWSAAFWHWRSPSTRAATPGS
jgi:hypothetical protein